MRRPALDFAFIVLLAAVLLSPLVVLPQARFLRLIVTVFSITASIKLYDHFQSAKSGFFPGPWVYFSSWVNSYAHVLRRTTRQAPPLRSELFQTLLCLTLGAASLALLIGLFHIDWHRHRFVLEHCAKAIGLFLVIQFLPNGLAPAFRLAGLPAMNFAGPFFLARTPAEFWRLYNRPAGQFLHEYVFKPAGGNRRPLWGTFFTFLVSGIIHEYVFDIPAGRVLGSQMAFFLIQGLAVMATIRLRPRGGLAVATVLLTFAFNLATVRLFLAGVNQVAPFYVDPIQYRH